MHSPAALARGPGEIMDEELVLPRTRQAGEQLPPGPAGDALDRQIDVTPAGDRGALLVDGLAGQVSSASLNWIAELSARAQLHQMSLPQIRFAATTLAWLARTAGQRYPAAPEWDKARGNAGSRTDRLVLAYVHGQRLRFDFKFGQLAEQSRKWLAEFGDDALILALAAFAAIGSRASNGLDLFQRAVDSPNADDKSRQACLGAMEFGDHIDDQGEILLGLSNDMMARGEDNENVRYRRATALRKLGRYEDALAEIDHALDIFDAAGRSLVHEQYAQERRAIIAAQDGRRRAENLVKEVGEQISAQFDQQVAAAAAALEEKISAASSQLGERIDVAQAMVSDGLLKMVEILGLFVTLLGFVVGSGAVIVKARSFSERAAAMALVVVGSLVFFVLLRLVVSIRRKR
jgi:tetratricopeptide (TPR) repeat protein